MFFNSFSYKSNAEIKKMQWLFNDPHAFFSAATAKAKATTTAATAVATTTSTVTTIATYITIYIPGSTKASCGARIVLYSLVALHPPRSGPPSFAARVTPGAALPPSAGDVPGAGG